MPSRLATCCFRCSLHLSFSSGFWAGVGWVWCFILEAGQMVYSLDVLLFHQSGFCWCQSLVLLMCHKRLCQLGVWQVDLLVVPMYFDCWTWPLSSPAIGIFGTLRTVSLKLTLHLTIICQFGAYMQCPLLILLYPSQHPSIPLLSSFPALVFITKMLAPQSGRSAKFSLALCIASYGVLLFSAHVDVLFFSNTAWWIVSGHRFLGSCAVNSIALVCSKSVWFNHSVTPFSWGVSCTIKLLIMPWASRWASNSFERYSSPWSDWMILIHLPYCVLIQASYSLYFDNTSNS